MRSGRGGRPPARGEGTKALPEMFFYRIVAVWEEIEELSIFYLFLIFWLIPPCAGDKEVMWVPAPP